MKKTLVGTLFAFLVLAISAGSVLAKSGYQTSFNAKYNTSGTKLDSCNVCHTSSNPSNNDLNPYGADFGKNNHDYTRIESLDSDNDSYTNIAEIRALTNPGVAGDKPTTTPTTTPPTTTPPTTTPPTPPTTAPPTTNPGPVKNGCLRCHSISDGEGQGTTPQNTERHPNNWVSIHADKTNATCLTCHRDSFCNSCHSVESQATIGGQATDNSKAKASSKTKVSSKAKAESERDDDERERDDD